MRKKLGLVALKTTSKDPKHLEGGVTLKSGLDQPAERNRLDWCTRQIRFNKRFMGDNFGERKRAPSQETKTQNQPSLGSLTMGMGT
ncbi:MAG: hypothetical protein CM15mV57_850 [uncultured marine virus]|nr:MAG: hypothetical protein CM15mV57_850 [uncultured marine virus]